MAGDEVVIMRFIKPNTLVVAFMRNLEDPKQDELSRSMNAEYYRHAESCRSSHSQHSAVPCPMNRSEGELVTVYDSCDGVLRGYIMGMDIKEKEKHLVFLPENGEIRSYQPGDIHPLKMECVRTAPRARILIVEEAPGDFGKGGSPSSEEELEKWSEKQDCKLYCKRNRQINNFVWKGDIIRLGKDRAGGRDSYSDLFRLDETKSSNVDERYQNSIGARAKCKTHSQENDPILKLFDKRDDDGKKYRRFLDKKLKPYFKRSEENRPYASSIDIRQKVLTNCSSTQMCESNLDDRFCESNSSVNSFIRPEYWNLKVRKQLVEGNPFAGHSNLSPSQGSIQNLQPTISASSINEERGKEYRLVPALDGSVLKDLPRTQKMKNPFAKCNVFYEEEKRLRRLQLETFAFGNNLRAPYMSELEVPFLKQYGKALKASFAKHSSSIQQYAVPNLLNKRNVFVIDASEERSMSYLIPIVAELKETHQPGMKNVAKPMTLIIVDSIDTCDAVYAKLVGMLQIVDLNYMNVKILTDAEEDLEKELQNAKFLELLIVLDDVLYNLIDGPYFKYYLYKTNRIVFDNVDVMMSSQLERFLQAYFGMWIEISHSIDHREFPKPQVVVQSTKWSSFLQDLEASMEDPIFIMPPMDSILFGNMRIEIRFVEEVHPSEDFYFKSVAVITLIEDTVEAQNIIIVCSCSEDASKLFHSLQGQIAQFDGALINQIATEEQFETLSRITVCTDQTISKLCVTSDAILVHFGIPAKQAQFGMRHCVLWPTISGDSDQRIIYAILAASDPDLVRKAEKLKSLGSQVPFAMEEFLRKGIAAQESSKDMCSGILWHGFCNETKCDSRHSFILAELNQQHIMPCGGEITVRIIEVNNASSYVAQLVSRKEWRGGKLTEVQNYDEESNVQSRGLQEFYAVASNRVSLESFDNEDYVAVQRDGNYERAKIIKYYSRSKNVLLDCIDSGVQVTRKLSDQTLLKLPENVKNCAGHTVELIVCNLKPIKKSLKDPPIKQDIPSEISALTRNRLFQCRVLGCIGRRVWVDRMQVKKTTPLGMQLRLHRMLLSLKLAEESSGHVQTLRELCIDAGMHPESGMFVNKKDSVMRDSEYCQPGEGVQWAHLTVSSNLTVVCTNIVDPYNIYCFNDSFTEQFSRMQASLNEWMENMPRDNTWLMKGYFIKGNLVAFNTLGSDGWARGIIVSENEVGEHSRVYEVFDADTGISYFDIICSELFPLPKSVIQILPFQAIKIKIANVLPIDTTVWDEDAREFLEAELLSKNKEQILNVEVLRKMMSDVNFCNAYEVLTSKKENSQLDCGEQMVKHGVAVLNDGRNIKQCSRDDLNISTVTEEAKAGVTEFSLAPYEIGAMDFLALNAKVLGNALSGTASTSKCKGSSYNSWKIRTTAEVPPTFQRCAIEWFQTDAEVFIRALVPDIKAWEETPAIGNDKKTLKFLTRNPPGYGVKLELFKKVEREIETTLLGQYAKIKLVKRFTGLTWQSLTSGGSSDANLGITCNQYLSEDDFIQSTGKFPISSGSGDESEASEGIYEDDKRFDDCDWD